jgi:magnesium-transporting ATPase (P-type)
MEEYQASLKSQGLTRKPDDEELIMQNFATNHSLSLIKGELLGDPMEDELFRFSSSSMTDQHEESSIMDPDEPVHLRKIHFPGSILASKPHIYEFSQAIEMKLKEEGLSRPLFVLSVWDFKSSLQRMSVVVRDPKDGATYVFTKGAPERVVQLCRPESVPANVQNSIRKFTKHGYRVLAFGYKQIDGSNLEVTAAHTDATQRLLRKRPHLPRHRPLQEQPQRTNQANHPEPQASRLQGRHDHGRQHQHSHQHRQKLPHR